MMPPYKHDMKFVSVLFWSLVICVDLLAATTDSLLAIYTSAQNPQEKHQISLALAERYLLQHQVDAALELAEESIRLIEGSGSQSQLAASYLILGRSLIRNNQFNESDSVLDYALGVVSEQERDLSVQLYLTKFENDLRRGVPKEGLEDLQVARSLIGPDSLGISMAEYCTKYGIYLLFQTQLLESLNWLLRAKELASAQHFELWQSINHNLATIYIEIGAYDKALQVVQENERLARQEQAPYRELFSLFTIATAFEMKEQYDSVKIICRRAERLKESAQISTSFGYIYFQLGLAYLAEEKLDSALEAFRAGIDLSEQQQERKELGECHYGMSLAYLKGDDLESAQFHAEKAQDLLFYYIDDLNFHHAEIHARQQNFERAYAIMNQGYLEQKAQSQAPSSFRIIETLLTNQFKQEKEKADLQYKRSLERQIFYGALLFLFLASLTLLFVLYFQAKSKRRLSRLNKELQVKNQDLTHFAYITSHDLKEPIRNINSFAGLINASLKRNQVDITRFQEYLGFIMSSSKTSYQIIDSLRTYTNLANDEIKYSQVPIGEAWQTVEEDCKNAFQERNGELHFSNPDQIGAVYFSAPMLGLILRNLVRNGLIHNEAKIPMVKVSLEEKGDKIVFKVSDNGKGIDPRFHQQIFQPFATLANKSITQSSGLGLAICKSILEKTGNSIWMESEKGKGSHFYFSVKKKKT